MEMTSHFYTVIPFLLIPLKNQASTEIADVETMLVEKIHKARDHHSATDHFDSTGFDFSFQVPN